ncbi:MAG: M56 family metallopeptidase [Oscillospiraceae bacterium]|nr:M56 family metallopeptidase [Oscillospiraceae bacterium]
MLGEILKALLITSLAGTCLTAIITIAKPITKRTFGYAWHYYIWLAVLAVMLLPVRFNLPQKSDTVPVVAQQTVQNVQTVQTADNVIPTVQTEPETDIWQTGTGFVKGIIDNRLNILAYLWLVGAITLLLINLIGYIRLIIKMRKDSVVVSCPQIADFTRRNVTARVWGNTASPFMTGIFRPTLVMPARELTEEQLNNILRHEMTHFKRHDILYKWFVTIVKCLHWFNPVIWYVSKQINTECEISCDMAVTLAMNKTQEMSYIDTVLALLPTGKTKQIPLTTQMASSKRVLKRRFEMIRNKRKTSKFVSVLSVAVAVVMLGTTVFASGVLSDLATEDYTIEIIDNNGKIDFVNKPFIENSEVYVPLRETLEKTGTMENEGSKIEWNDGKLNVCIVDNTDSDATMFNSFNMEIGKSELATNYNSYTVPYTFNSKEDIAVSIRDFNDVDTDSLNSTDIDTDNVSVYDVTTADDGITYSLNRAGVYVGIAKYDVTTGSITLSRKADVEGNYVKYTIKNKDADTDSLNSTDNVSVYDVSIADDSISYSINSAADIDTDNVLVYYDVDIDSQNSIDINTVNVDISNPRAMDNAPVLINSVTYIPYSYLNSMLNGEKYSISYDVYDKSGNLIDKKSTEAIIVNFEE